MKELVNIQNELKAPKSQFNSFGKYHYRNCEDILEAVKPLLLKYECSLIVKDDLVFIGDRYYVKAIATLTKGDASVEAYAFAREEENKKGMDGSQVTGASSSYARKYALNGLFLIDDTKDADSQDNTQKPTITKQLEYNCVDCNKKIEKHGQHSVETLVSLSNQKFGKVLCVECANKNKK